MEPNQPDLKGAGDRSIHVQATSEMADGSRASLVPSDTPQRIYISKHSVFEQALQTLTLQLHEARTCIIGNDEFISSVTIDVPAHGTYTAGQTKKFWGDYKLTEHDALESAKLAALVYLQKKRIILVDDINLDELTRREADLAKCQQKLFTASSWTTLLEERAESLQSQLNVLREENKKLVAEKKLMKVKEEVSTPSSSKLKTEASTAGSQNVIKNTSTPPAFENQGGTSLLDPGKGRALRTGNAKRKLFKN